MFTEKVGRTSSKHDLLVSPNVENNINDVIICYNILDVPVRYVTSYLYLGIDIDSGLTFKQYYRNMFKKI